MSATRTLVSPSTGTAVRPRGNRHAERVARPAGCPSARTTARPAPVPVPAARPAQPVRGTHLTARGRAAVVAALVLLLLAAFSLGRTGAEGSTSAPAQAQVQEATVMPGETLWAVAQRLAPGQDPRPVVDQIRRLNGLTSADLQAGQQLLLPVAR
jgi:LysM repeat protein